MTSAEDSAGLPFAECREAGDYPTLIIDFHDGRQHKDVRMLLDSGARHNYVASSLLDELGVAIKPKHFREFVRDIGPGRASLSDEGRQRLVSYFSEHLLPVTVSDSDYETSGQSWFRVVAQWETSTFFSLCTLGGCEGSYEISPKQFRCGYRQGLLSAALAKDLGMNIVIAGSSRTVTINVDA